MYHFIIKIPNQFIFFIMHISQKIGSRHPNFFGPTPPNFSPSFPPTCQFCLPPTSPPSQTTNTEYPRRKPPTPPPPKPPTSPPPIQWPTPRMPPSSPRPSSDQPTSPTPKTMIAPQDTNASNDATDLVAKRYVEATIEVEDDEGLVTPYNTRYNSSLISYHFWILNSWKVFSSGFVPARELDFIFSWSEFLFVMHNFIIQAKLNSYEFSL